MVRHLTSLLLWGGWYAGDEVVRWLEEKLDANQRHLSGTTLEEFNQKTGRDLSVVAWPDRQSDAGAHDRGARSCQPYGITLSMGCPFAWQEAVWKPEWGTYRRRDLSGHHVVDGGLLSNFPIHLFVSSDENIDGSWGKARNQMMLSAF